MPAVVACPKCKKKYKLPDNMLGKGVKCTECATQFKAAAPNAKQSPQPDRRQMAAAQQARAKKAQDLKALGVSGTIERPADIFSGSAMTGTPDPLGNHVIQDPGFGEGAEQTVAPKQTEEPDNPHASMLSNPALAKKKKKKVAKQAKTGGGRSFFGAKACFVLAALTAIGAIYLIVAGPNKPEGIPNLVGYAIGTFLVPIALLIGGLYLQRKPKKSKKS